VIGCYSKPCFCPFIRSSLLHPFSFPPLFHSIIFPVIFPDFSSFYS
jgi:hypothetical protein